MGNTKWERGKKVSRPVLGWGSWGGTHDQDGSHRKTHGTHMAHLKSPTATLSQVGLGRLRPGRLALEGGTHRQAGSENKTHGGHVGTEPYLQSATAALSKVGGHGVEAIPSERDGALTH
jgi:hypothetical protein